MAKNIGISVDAWEGKHYKRVNKYARQVDDIYSALSQEAGIIGASITNFNQNKPFTFADYPITKQRIDKLLKNLQNNISIVIDNGTREEWLLACQKNDAIVKNVFNNQKLDKVRLGHYYSRNLEALDAFQKRKVNGMNLSDRVWKLTDQTKQELEMSIDLGLTGGKSASQMGREIKKHLNDPNRLFRRVKDERGQLQLSKNAKAYHPGQGVYRSSKANAMRLTRTETNMAYRASDNERWGQLDFILGYEIKRSNNPYPCPVCEALKGKYPKTFKFVGWHPNCRCFQVPILADLEDFLDYETKILDGEDVSEYGFKNEIAELPNNFTQWVSQNSKTLASRKSVPYFIRDNFKPTEIKDGLQLAPAKKVKSKEEKEAIQKRWNKRVASKKYNEALQDISGKYSEKSDSIKKLVSDIESDINNGQSLSKIESSIERLNHKVKIKDLWDERVEENRLGTLLVDVKGMKQQYGLEATQSVFNAVSDKLETWSSLSFEQQKNKLLFEINWVEQHKKYDTWKSAQSAYKKQLSVVDYQLSKQTIQKEASFDLDFAKTTKSANVKNLAKELDELLNSNAPIADIQSKANALNSKVLQLETAKQNRLLKKKSQSLGNIDESKFSQKRKDEALWAIIPEQADEKLRPVTAKVWNKATLEEKTAAYEYTRGSGGFNRPLRGYDSSWYDFKGLGKVDLNNEGKAQQILELTKLIDKTSSPFDVWLQRGVDERGMSSFLGLDKMAFDNMTEKQLQSLVGKSFTDTAFTSCGSAKGKGFGGNIFNIYCPEGTKMIYAEPFSYYGGSKGKIWNGKSKKSLEYELETIIQRNTSFRITKIEKKYGRVYIDMEVVAQ